MPLQLFWPGSVQFLSQAMASGIQAIRHGFCPEGQLMPHLMPSQVAVPPGTSGQAVQPAPQLATEVLSMHLPGHMCWPVGQPIGS